MFRSSRLVLFGRAMFAAAFLATACGDEVDHPWIRLDPGSPHRIIEFSGADAGQVVIAANPEISREEALELGRLVQSQAPPGATVNVRIYNDETTARTWRTVAGNLSVEHLLVIVSSSSATGRPEVRWVRPDSLDAPSGPLQTTALPDSLSPPDSSSPPGARLPPTLPPRRQVSDLASRLQQVTVVVEHAPRPTRPRSGSLP